MIFTVQHFSQSTAYPQPRGLLLFDILVRRSEVEDYDNFRRSLIDWLGANTSGWTVFDLALGVFKIEFPNADDALLCYLRYSG